MHAEAQVPQFMPCISPQFWSSCNGDGVKYDQYQGADQCSPDGTLQEEWFPECQYMWVPFEQVPQPQQYPMLQVEYCNQEIPYEECSFLEEQEAAQMQHPQPQFEMNNEHMQFDNQGEVVWNDSETYLPYVPCHFQPNLHAHPCGPQFQDSECQYFQVLPENGGLEYQTIFHHELSYDPTYQMQGESPDAEFVSYKGCAPISEPTVESIQQPYSFNYVQPDQYNQPQQQHIMYYFVPEPAHQPEIIDEQYHAANHASTTGQYHNHYSNVSYFPQYDEIEQPRKVLPNHEISAPGVQEGGCQMTNKGEFIPYENQQVPQIVFYPRCYNEEELQAYVPSDTTTSYQCQIQSGSAQPHEVEHPTPFVPQGTVAQPTYLFKYISSEDQHQVEPFKSTGMCMQNYYGQQRSLECIPGNSDYLIQNRAPVVQSGGPHCQYVVEPSHLSCFNSQRQYVYAPLCEQYTRHQQQHIVNTENVVEYAPCFKQGPLMPNAIPRGMPNQQYNNVLNYQQNILPTHAPFQVHEHQQQRKINSSPTQCYLRGEQEMRQSYASPHDQLKSLGTSLDPSPFCNPGFQSQQSFHDSDYSVNEQKLEEKKKALVLSNECNSVPLAQETVSCQATWCGTEQLIRSEATLGEKSHELVQLKQEENLMDPRPSSLLKEESQIAEELMEINDSDAEER